MFMQPTVLPGQPGFTIDVTDFSSDGSDQVLSVIQSGSKIVPDAAEHRILIQDYFRRGGVIKKDPASPRQPVGRKDFLGVVSPGVPMENTQQRISVRLRKAINQMEAVDFASLVEDHTKDLETSLNGTVIAQIRKLVSPPHLEKYLAVFGISMGDTSLNPEPKSVLSSLVNGRFSTPECKYEDVLTMDVAKHFSLTARAIFYRLITEGNWASAVQLIELTKANHVWSILSPQDDYFYRPVPSSQIPDNPSATRGGRFLALFK